MAREVPTEAVDPKVKPGRAPFAKAFAALKQSDFRTFEDAEPLYLAAMEQFDALVRAGKTDSGDHNNGKGDFFNDFTALLLERASGKQFDTRAEVPGLLMATYSLDVAYPNAGPVLLTVETKATGIPRHRGNEKQKNPAGRPGSQDLKKRVREAAFKDIDIKGEHSRRLGEGGGANADLRTWLNATPPQNWLILSVRVLSAADLAKTLEIAEVAARWFKGCGVYAFGHVGWDIKAAYEPKPVPRHLQLDRVMHELATALRALP